MSLPRRIDSLTSLRFAAAALVAAGHAGELPYYSFASQNVIYFAQGVTFFFVLSGFILAHTYKGMTRQDIPTFLVARVARIWPVHLLTLAAVLISLPPATWGLPDLLTNAFLQQALVPYADWYFSYNAVSWSISAEFWFYLAFPMLILTVQRSITGTAIACVAWLACVLAVVIALGLPVSRSHAQVTAHALLQINPAVRIIEFCIGILAYFVLNRAGSYRGTTLHEGMALLACLAALAAANWAYTGLSGALPSQLLLWLQVSGPAIPIAVMIAIFATEGGAISKALRQKALVYLGEISFALYMVHQIILYYVHRYHPQWAADHPYLSYAVYWLTVIGVSAVVYEAVEKPCRSIIRGLLPTRYQMLGANNSSALACPKA